MATVEQLRGSLADGDIRSAVESDAVDGVTPSAVVTPPDPESVADVVRETYSERLTIVPRGAGTKLDWGCPPSTVDLVVDVSRLDAVLEHAAGDLVVRVQPGVRLTALADALAPAGQRLAIDEVVPGSTVGGVICTGLSGPSRLLYGPVRDLLIGITVIRADGTVTRSGGKVVKNVAGYDLGKLYTGSYGTLGLVTEAIFRLHPLPERAAWVTVELPDEEALRVRAAAVLDSQVVPSAIEVNRDRPDAPLTLALLLEGVAAGVDARSETVERLLGATATTRDEQPAWWATLPGATTVKISVPIAEVANVIRAVGEAAARIGLTAQTRGSAGVGTLYVGLPAECDPPDVGRFVDAVRASCKSAGGTAVILRAPSQVRSAVDPWGPVEGLALMHRIKQQFDPEGRLSPGRFVGGI